MTDGSVCSLRTAYRLPALGVILLFKIQFFLWNINRKRGVAKRMEESNLKVIFCMLESRNCWFPVMLIGKGKKREEANLKVKLKAHF
jgi:hypothetical protein